MCRRNNYLASKNWCDNEAIASVFVGCLHWSEQIICNDFSKHTYKKNDSDVKQFYQTTRKVYNHTRLNVTFSDNQNTRPCICLRMSKYTNIAAARRVSSWCALESIVCIRYVVLFAHFINDKLHIQLISQWNWSSTTNEWK